MEDKQLEQVCDSVLCIFAEYTEREIINALLLEPESAKALEIRARKAQLDAAKAKFMAEIKSGDANRRARAINSLKRPTKG